MGQGDGSLCCSWGIKRERTADCDFNNTGDGSLCCTKSAYDSK